MSFLALSADAGTNTALDSLSTALVNSFSSLSGKMVDFVGSLMPPLMILLGAVTLVSFGIKIFRRFSGAK